jgi:hypothetical protein
VLLVAGCFDVFVAGQEENIPSSWPVSEASITPPTEQKAFLLSNTTETEAYAEQLITETESEQGESNASAGTAFETATPEINLVTANDSEVKDSISDTSHGVKLTQDFDTSKIATFLTTETVPGAINNSVQELTTSIWLELTQQESTASETKLETPTPEAGASSSRGLNQDTTDTTFSGLELTQKESTGSETKLETLIPESGPSPSRELNEDTTFTESSGLELTQQEATASEKTGCVTTSPELGSEPQRTVSEGTTATTSSELESTTSGGNIELITLPYQCTRPGRFPARPSCSEYHVCRRVGFWLLHHKETCRFGRKFSSRYGICVRGRSSDCGTGPFSWDGQSSETSENSSRELNNDNSAEDDKDDSHSDENVKTSKINLLRALLKEKKKHFRIFKGSAGV